MSDNRAHPRRKLTEKIDMIDINNGQMLGHLVNISAGGFMVFTDRAPEVNRLFQMRLQSNSSISGLDGVEIGAECLWSRAITESGHFWAGFQIIDISDEGRGLVQHLLEEWSE